MKTTYKKLCAPNLSVGSSLTLGPSFRVEYGFYPLVGRRVGGRREKVCPACISKTVRCRKLILGRDIGLEV